MNRLQELWAQGDAAVGAWVTLGDTIVAEAVGAAGFDYACVDLQHGAIGYADAVPMLQALALGETMPVVRVPWNEPGVIGKVLDAGALAVVVPMVNTADQAAAAVRACFYPPVGARSYGPVAAGLRRSDYHSSANGIVACIPMIETAEAIANIDDILATEGVDAIYVGPSDLSISLGLAPGNHDHEPAFADALDTILSACARHDVVAGIHASVALAPKRLEQGFRMVTATTDLVALRQAVAEAAAIVPARD